MKKIALLYWGKGGSTEKVAKLVYNQFDSEIIDLFDLESFDLKDIEKYEMGILAAPTIGADYWEDATSNNLWNKFFRNIEQLDLSKKTVAFVGLGDQVLYPKHFVAGLGLFQKELSKTNVKIIGRWPTDGYDFTESQGEKDGMFYGLAIDEQNQWDITEERVKAWTDQLKKEMGY